MKHKIFLFLLPMLAAEWLGSCHKDSIPPNTNPPPIDYTVLPPATQEGKNTFGCLVNGEVWVPRVPLFAVTYRAIDALVWEKNGSGAGIISTNLVDVEQNIDNWFVFTFGNTIFMPCSLCADEVFAEFRTATGDNYMSDLRVSQTNCVKITKIDSIENIISGTFGFTLYTDSTNLNDKIEITDGRFDMKYYPQ